MKSIILQLVLFTILSSVVLPQEIVFGCNSGQLLTFDNTTNISRCENCPQKCAQCIKIGSKMTCTHCEKSHYMTDTKECLPCTEHCEECTGPGLDRCFSIPTGSYFNRISRSIFLCPEGCSTCDHEGNCMACLAEHRTEPILDEKGLQKKKYNNGLVKCTRCHHNGCLICEKVTEVEVCNHCLPGFGNHPYLRICSPCPSGCLTCGSSSTLCSFCKEGLQINQNADCVKIQDPNCGSFDVNNQRCIWCQKGWMVDPSDRSRCTSCSVIDPLCSSCVLLAPLEKRLDSQSKGMKCWACLAGFNPDPLTGKCKACSENCFSCSSNGKCYTCKVGYHLSKDRQSCEINSIEHCEKMHESGECISCESGYFLDVSKTGISRCGKCNDNCMTCADGTKTGCVKCAISKLALKEDLAVNLNPYIYQSTHECVDTCPSLSAKGKPLQIDEFNRLCVYNNEEEKPQPPKKQGKYEFRRRVNEKGKESLLLDSVEFVMTLNRYTQMNQVEAHTWAASHPEESRQLSPQCNYRGRISERLSFDRETYFECLCNKGFHGLTCLIEEELYNVMEAFLSTFIKDLDPMIGLLDEKRFYSIFNNLNQAVMNYNTLIRMTNLLHNYLKANHLESKAPMVFLGSIDGLLKVHYKQHLEIDRDIYAKRLDIDKAYLKMSIYSRLHSIITLAEQVLTNSIKYSSNYNVSSSTSFQSIFVSPNQNTFEHNSGSSLFIFPSDMLNMGNNRHPVEFSVESQKLAASYKEYDVVGWVWSSLLFSLAKYEGYIASFVFSLNIVQKGDGLILKGVEDETDVLTIKYPLKIVPVQGDVKKSLRCLSMRFDRNNPKMHSIKEFFIEVTGYFEDSKDPYVVCKFERPILEDVFFTVGYTGENKNSRTSVIERRAMDESDDFDLSLEVTMPISDGMKDSKMLIPVLFLGLLMSFF